MACPLSITGITLDCQSSIGGIKEVYITTYGDFTPVLDKPETMITGLTQNIESETAKFKKYEFRKQTGSMTSTLNVDEVAGINYVSTELNLVFTKMETKKRLEISALAIGQLIVIVKDSNNKYWYLGYNDYVSATAGSANTGTAKGDSNNYSLTLKDESDTFPYEIEESVVLANLFGYTPPTDEPTEE